MLRPYDIWGDTMTWHTRNPALLARDIDAMAHHFPHWRLDVQAGPAWMGALPSPVRPGPPLDARRNALRAAGFAEVNAAGTIYVLVPLLVRYPAEWPNSEPAVQYAPRWLDAIGLPRYSSAHHLVQDGRACLYGYGEWYAQPIHAMIQQRVINHTLSLLKIAAGTSPHEAFIGRVAH